MRIQGLQGKNLVEVMCVVARDERGGPVGWLMSSSKSGGVRCSPLYVWFYPQDPFHTTTGRFHHMARINRTQGLALRRIPF
jgi:hypothetical protein